MDIFLEHLTIGYFDFKGKSSRSDFWSYIMSLMMINAVCFLVLFLIYFSESTVDDNDVLYYGNITETMHWISKSGNLLLPAVFIFTVWYIYLIIPTLAITVRRLHDAGKSGWWVAVCVASLIISAFGTAQTFFSALAVVLFIIILDFCLTKGQIKTHTVFAH